MMVELSVDLLGLALIYLNKTRQEVTAGNLLEVCEKILQWSELCSRKSGFGDGRQKMVVKDGHIWVDEEILSNDDGEVWRYVEPYGIVKEKVVVDYD